MLKSAVSTTKAKQSIIKETKNFVAEKQRLIGYNNKTHQAEEDYFINKYLTHSKQF